MKLSDILDSLGNLSWSKAVIVALIIGFSSFIFVLYESYTHTMQIDRSERALQLAKNAEEYHKLFSDELTDEQKSIYQSAVEVAKNASTEEGISSPFTEQHIKFLSGFFPWLLMSFVYVSSYGNEKYVGMFGSLMFGMISGALLTLFPRIMWPYGNLILIPWFLFIVVIIFFALYIKVKDKKPLNN